VPSHCLPHTARYTYPRRPHQLHTLLDIPHLLIAAPHLGCSFQNLDSTQSPSTTELPPVNTAMLFFLPFLMAAPMLILAAPMPATLHVLHRRYYPWTPVRWAVAPKEIKADTTYDLRWKGGSGNGYVSDPSQSGGQKADRQEVYFIPQWEGQPDYKVGVDKLPRLWADSGPLSLRAGGGYRFNQPLVRQMAHAQAGCLPEGHNLVSRSSGRNPRRRVSGPPPEEFFELLPCSHPCLWLGLVRLISTLTSSIIAVNDVTEGPGSVWYDVTGMLPFVASK